MSRIKPPSPSMAVAIAALVIAIAGTAVASVGTISALTKSEKKQVKKIAGKIADQRIRSLASGLAVGSAGTAGTAERAKTADFAAVAGNAPEQLWAIVNADGTLFRATPGILSSAQDGEGRNVINTNRDLSGCFFVATLGGNTPDEGIRGDISVNPLSGDPKGLYVLTSSPAQVNAPLAFTLLISC